MLSVWLYRVVLILALAGLAVTPQAGTTTPAIAARNETVSVPFTAGQLGVLTQTSYQGPVQITVSGFGNTAPTIQMDAFYEFTDIYGQLLPSPTREPGYGIWINGRYADDFVNPIPAYNPSHVYTFTMEAPGGTLRFGIEDGYPIDNSGGYTVTVTPLYSEPTATPQPTATATPQPTATPIPPPQKPSYHFDTLTTLNKQGQHQTQFRRQEQGYLMVAWHVQHLSSPTSAEVKITYEVPSRSGWKVLSSPLPADVTTINGANHYRAAFYAPKSYTGLRFVVSIHLMSRWSAKRTATIYVQP